VRAVGRGEAEVLATVEACVWLQLLQGGVALWSCVDMEVTSVSIRVAVVTAVTSTEAPAALS